MILGCCCRCCIAVMMMGCYNHSRHFLLEAITSFSCRLLLYQISSRVRKHVNLESIVFAFLLTEFSIRAQSCGFNIRYRTTLASPENRLVSFEHIQYSYHNMEHCKWKRRPTQIYGGWARAGSFIILDTARCLSRAVRDLTGREHSYIECGKSPSCILTDRSF